MCFLSILSIKCGNWFYWADRAERADWAESKESPVFICENVGSSNPFFGTLTYLDSIIYIAGNLNPS
jgi:hypothetical protein